MLVPFLHSPPEVNRWLTLGCTTLLALCGGSLYGFGAYSIALASALPNIHHVDLLGSMGDFGLFSGIFMGCFYDNFGPTWTSALAGCIVFTGYFFTYLIVSGYFTTNFFALAVLFFMVGLGSAGFFYTAIGTNARNFPRKRRGMVAGYVLMLFGLTATVFTAVFTFVLQQNVRTYMLFLAVCVGCAALLSTLFTTSINKSSPVDETMPLLPSTDIFGENAQSGTATSKPSIGPFSPDLEQQKRQQQSASVSAASATASSSVVAAVGSVPSPSTSGASSRAVSLDADNAPMGYQGSPAPSTASMRLHRKSKIRHFRRGTAELPKYGTCCFPVVSHPDFWLLFSILFLVAGSGLMWKNKIGSISHALRVGSIRNAELVMTFALTNAMVRLLAGWCSDTFEHRIARPMWLLFTIPIMCLSHLAYIAFTASATSSPHSASASTLPLAVPWVVDACTALGYGATFTTVVSLVSLYFGVADFGTNYGLISLGPAFAGPMFTYVSDVFAELVSDGGAAECVGAPCYLLTFVFTTVALFVAFVLSAVLVRRNTWRQHVKEHGGVTHETAVIQASLAALAKQQQQDHKQQQQQQQP